MAILYFFFGFWIEIIYFIAIIIVIIGCMSQVFVALLDWYLENKELRQKRKHLKVKIQPNEIEE